MTKKTAYIKAVERAGVLTSYVRKQAEIFYIGYNLLEDYLKTSRIIDCEQDKEKIRLYLYILHQTSSHIKKKALHI